ncbi:MAG: hypothetical protein ACK457_04340 [Flavobacteriia bacterium]|jgi:hypothetical protein
MKLNEFNKEEKSKKKDQIIQRLKSIKNISIDQAKQLFDNLETYCELIINYTLKNTDEQDQGI